MSQLVPRSLCRMTMAPTQLLKSLRAAAAIRLRAERRQPLQQQRHGWTLVGDDAVPTTTTGTTGTSTTTAGGSASAGLLSMSATMRA